MVLVGVVGMLLVAVGLVAVNVVLKFANVSDNKKGRIQMGLFIFTAISMYELSSVVFK